MAASLIINHGGIPHINTFINFHKPLEASAQEELAAIDLGIQYKGQMSAAQIERSRENITSSIDFLASKIAESPGTTQALAALKANMEQRLETLGGRLVSPPIVHAESSCNTCFFLSALAAVAAIAIPIIAASFSR